MQLENLNKFTDQELLTQFSLVVRKEREAITTVVFYLSEIDERKLYLKEAFSSLFSFVTQKFGYSEGAAYRRIQAARVSQLFPEVLELLSQGKISLMTLSLIEPHLTRENGKKLIKQVMGKSKREVEAILSELSFKKINYKDVIRRLPVVSVKVEGGGKALAPIKVPSAFPPPPSETKTAQNFTFTSGSSGVSTDENCQPSTIETENKPVQKTNDIPKQEIRRIKIEFVAEEGMAKKIERAKEILRHKFPEGRFEDIFNQALEDMLEKRDPERKIERVEKRNEKKVIKCEEKTEKEEEKQQESEEKINESEKKTEKQKERYEENQKKPIEMAEMAEKKPVPSKPQLNHPAKSMANRYISQEIRRKIWLRDGGKCTYESSDGKRCGEKGFLEIDHVRPFALGGLSTEENLRLLCGQHNRWRAEQTFKHQNT